MRCVRCRGDGWVTVVRKIDGVDYDFCAPCPVCRKPANLPNDGKSASSEREET